jgi:hypothetical protein
MAKKTEKAEVTQVEDDGSNVEMLDKDKGLVNLDGGQTAQEVEQVVEPEPVEDDARSAIYARHMEKRKEELGVTDEPVVAETVKPEPPADEEVTVKVNGKERKVAKSKVEAAGGVDAYQKNAAASELLNHASAETRRLREMETQLIARSQELERRERESAKAVTKPEPPDEGARKLMAKQYHEAMLEGDMDKAGELLIRIQSAPQATDIDPEKIAERAVQRARAELTAEQRKTQAERFEQERVEAAQQFEERYADLAEDPDLRAMADSKTLDIYNEHPDWGPKMIIEEASRQVRDFVGRLTKRTTVEDKMTAKRSLTVIKGGSARSVSRPEPAPQTRSEYVEHLRKQRGLDA